MKARVIYLSRSSPKTILLPKLVEMATPLATSKLSSLREIIESQGYVSPDDIDTLGKISRDIMKQADSAEKRVLAFVLGQLSEILRQRFDGEPMTADASGKLWQNLLHPVKDAIALLMETAQEQNALAIADQLITLTQQ